jgi:hypothetical protein
MEEIYKVAKFVLDQEISTLKSGCKNLTEQIKELEEQVAKTSAATVFKYLPWKESVFDNWSIIGMHHYRVQGRQYLFVAMGNSKNQVVKAHGYGDIGVFEALAVKIRELSSKKEV